MRDEQINPCGMSLLASSLIGFNVIFCQTRHRCLTSLFREEWDLHSPKYKIQKKGSNLNIHRSQKKKADHISHETKQCCLDLHRSTGVSAKKEHIFTTYDREQLLWAYGCNHVILADTIVVRRAASYSVPPYITECRTLTKQFLRPSQDELELLDAMFRCSSSCEYRFEGC